MNEGRSKVANPQPDSFIKINPDVMEALAKIRIPGEARQVLDFIIRKTWGWHKTWDRIALSQFVLGTNIKKVNILRALSKLMTMNLIIIQKDNANGHKYRFNKDFENWKPLSKKITTPKSLSKKITSVIQKDNESLSKKIPTKETNTKETNTKDKSTPSLKSLPVENVDNSPYPKPTQEKLKELAEMAAKVQQAGFPIYLFIQRIKKKVGYFPPPKAMIKACQRYLEDKGKIENAWAWFENVVKDESGSYFANLNVQRSEQYKKEPVSIGKIINSMITDKSCLPTGALAGAPGG